MDLLDQLFTEAVGVDELYHVTSIENAIKIVRKNTFKLSPWLSSLERNKLETNKFYFGSFARHPVEIFGRSAEVIFVLDKDKIKQTHKIIPYNYHHYTHPQKGKDPYTFEFEDKVLSNYPYIKNFNSYIKEIFVNQKAGTSKEFPSLQINDAKKLNQIAKEFGIAIYFTNEEYANKENNRSLKRYMKRDHTDPVEYESIEKKKYPPSEGLKASDAKKLFEFKNYLNMVYNLMFWNEEKIIPNIRSYYSFLSYQYDTFYWYLKHEALGNNRKYDPQIRTLIPKIITIFKKAGVKTDEAFVKWMMLNRGTWVAKLDRLQNSLKESFYNNYNDQSSGTLYIYDTESPDKKVHAYLDWALHEDKIYVEVNNEFEKQGYATKLFNQLRKEFPECGIIHNGNLLNEGVRPDVYYHASPIELLTNILKTNMFIMSMASNAINYSDNKQSYPFYMSVARSLDSDYLKNTSRPLIILDKEKIKQNYRTFPFDYFAGKMHLDRELEDRIVSKNPEIKNFSQYIKSIHMSKWMPSINEIFKLCKTLNIPLYVYDGADNVNKLRQGTLMDSPRDIPPVRSVGDKLTTDDYQKCPKKLAFFYIVAMSNSKEEFLYNCNKNRIDPNDSDSKSLKEFIEFYIIGHDFFHGSDKYKKMWYQIILKLGRDKVYFHIIEELRRKHRDLLNGK